jgi:hypothetical protein
MVGNESTRCWLSRAGFGLFCLEWHLASQHKRAGWVSLLYISGADVDHDSIDSKGVVFKEEP